MYEPHLVDAATHRNRHGDGHEKYTRENRDRVMRMTRDLAIEQGYRADEIAVMHGYIGVIEFRSPVTLWLRRMWRSSFPTKEYL